MGLDKLKLRWLSLFDSTEQLGVVSALNVIVQRYGEKHRHYHTLAHVMACLDQLDSVRDKLDAPRSVELALWFHDVIYNTRETNNEALSAEFAREVLNTIGEGREVIEKVSNMIAVTKHPSMPGTEDEKYLVDIDLSILGSPVNAYRQYAEQIRQEYSHVPDDSYKKGRACVLETFLKQESIYHTVFFRNKYERAARENIQAELRQLTDV